MKKSFTLIELLVVIAIIAILASVIVVALNGARKRTKDVKIKNNVAQAVKSLLVYNAENGSFNITSCANSSTTLNLQCWNVAANMWGDPAIPVTGPTRNQIAILANDVKNTDSSTDFVVISDQTHYKIYGKLVSNNTQMFCKDSKGYSNTRAWITWNVNTDCNNVAW